MKNRLFFGKMKIKTLLCVFLQGKRRKRWSLNGAKKTRVVQSPKRCGVVWVATAKAEPSIYLHHTLLSSHSILFSFHTTSSLPHIFRTHSLPHLLLNSLHIINMLETITIFNQFNDDLFFLLQFKNNLKYKKMYF